MKLLPRPLAHLSCFLKNEGGVAAIEFSLVFLPFLLMVFGIFEFGRAFHMRATIDDIANQTIRQIYLAQIDPSEAEVSLETQMTSFARSLMETGDPALLTVDVTVGPGAQSRTMTINYVFRFAVNLTGQADTPLRVSRAFAGS